MVSIYRNNIEYATNFSTDNITTDTSDPLSGKLVNALLAATGCIKIEGDLLAVPLELSMSGGSTSSTYYAKYSKGCYGYNIIPMADNIVLDGFWSHYSMTGSSSSWYWSEPFMTIQKLSYPINNIKELDYMYIICCHPSTFSNCYNNTSGTITNSVVPPYNRISYNSNSSTFGFRFYKQVTDLSNLPIFEMDNLISKLIPNPATYSIEKPHGSASIRAYIEGDNIIVEGTNPNPSNTDYFYYYGNSYGSYGIDLGFMIAYKFK